MFYLHSNCSLEYDSCVFWLGSLFLPETAVKLNPLKDSFFTAPPCLESQTRHTPDMFRWLIQPRKAKKHPGTTNLLGGEHRETTPHVRNRGFSSPNFSWIHQRCKRGAGAVTSNSTCPIAL